MATGDYCTLANVREHVGIATADTDRDDLTLSLITSISRQIDDQCRRRFYGVTETRYFDYVDSMQMWMDEDVYTITTLTNGDGNTLTEDTDFYGWPYSGPPYRRLDIKSDSGSLFLWSGTTQRAISILGSWGFAITTPGPIERACILWVADYLSRQGDEGVSRVTLDGGEMSVAYEVVNPGSPPPLAALLLQPYRYVDVR